MRDMDLEGVMPLGGSLVHTALHTCKRMGLSRLCSPPSPSLSPVPLGLEVRGPGREDGAKALTISRCSAVIFRFCPFKSSKKLSILSRCICQRSQTRGSGVQVLVPALLLPLLKYKDLALGD